MKFARTNRIAQLSGMQSNEAYTRFGRRADGTGPGVIFIDYTCPNKSTRTASYRRVPSRQRFDISTRRAVRARLWNSTFTWRFNQL